MPVTNSKRSGAPVASATSTPLVEPDQAPPFLTRSSRDFAFRPYPATLAEYLPDPTEPVDRWYQAANSSNVRTTVAIINDRCGATPSMVVDPFAGAGSGAVVARRLGIPFFGIESDPVLTCIAIVKTFCTTDHAERLATGAVDATDGSDLVPSCLELVRAVRAATGDPLDLADMIADLRQCPTPVPGSAVVWGDSTTDAAWSMMEPASGRPVIYCSPPFGDASPRPAVPGELVQQAVRILTSAHLSKTAAQPEVFMPYGDLATGMLRRAAARLGKATVILEYEPPDSGVDDRLSIVERLESETPAKISSVLETRAFSARGLLSFVVGELV